MPTKIFVNLACRDLKRSKAFFEALGFSFNPTFTNDSGACMVIGENIFARLLAEEFFRSFTRKAIADATKTTEVLTCLSRDSRAEVDALVDAALAAGGTKPREPADHGFMYERSFEDPDGHIWEIMWMDPSAVATS